MTTNKPLRKRRTRKQINQLQLEFSATRPQPQQRTETPPVETSSNRPIVCQCPDWTPAAAEAFELAKKDRMKGITNNDHLPTSQQFSTFSDDPQPTASET